MPALTAARATGTPFWLALPPAAPGLTAISPEAVPLALRTIDVATGCAAGYDTWLGGVTA